MDDDLDGGGNNNDGGGGGNGGDDDDEDDEEEAAEMMVVVVVMMMKKKRKLSLCNYSVSRRNNSFSSSPRSGWFLDGRFDISWILVFFAINPLAITEMS
ncbi:hypothetical protein LguiA_004632 [Lonicera macranthoides]